MTATTVPNLNTFISALGEYSFSLMINDVDHERIAELLKKLPRMWGTMPPLEAHFAVDEGGHKMCDAMNNWVYTIGRSRRRSENGSTSLDGATVQTMLIYMFWTDMDFQRSILDNPELPETVADQPIGKRALEMFRRGHGGYWFLEQVRNWRGTSGKSRPSE